MNDLQSRVLAAALDLLSRNIRPTAPAIFGEVAGRDCLHRRKVETARKGLVEAGLWPARSHRRRPGPPPTPVPARPDRPRHEYLGPFAADMKQMARLRRRQRRFVELSRSPRPERTERP